jgi:predicted acyltransferase (DUF342 family)
MLWLLFFLICFTALFMLPLAPAVTEWRRKEDAEPLRVVREYDGNIAHFALRFRQFLNENIGQAAAEAANKEEAVGGSLQSVAYQIVGHGHQPEFDESEKAAKLTRKMIVAQTPLQLPEGMFFETEIYAAQGVASGSWVVLRAILSDGDIRLGQGCDVMRWVHAAGRVEFGSRSRLYGRISSEREIRLSRQSLFGRMNAPTICFGEVAAADSAGWAPMARLRHLSAPKGLVSEAAGRWLILGDCNIPDQTFHRGNLVVGGKLIVGIGAFIQGSVKSKGNLRLKGDLRIDGSVVGARSVRIGPGSIIAGPVVGEREIVIQTGSVIGSPHKPTTITAPLIRIEEGAIVHGTVWARDEGYVGAASRKKGQSR